MRKNRLNLRNGWIILALMICPTLVQGQRLPLPEIGQPPDFYRFAWEMFIYVNQPKQPHDQHLYWETWATVGEVFDPGAKRERIGSYHIAPQQSISQLDFIGAQPPETTQGCRKTPETAEQDVRLNDQTVQYINAYELWNLEGQEKMFQQRQRVSFPRDAVEVKAIWKRSLAIAERNMYYTRTTVSGEIQGLAGLHIMSKRTRNWVWMTFEHVNNNCRCQFINCYDFFGAYPPVGAKTIPTRNLAALVYRTGVTEQWQRYWRYFRLTGVQTVFMNGEEEPTLLGNSIPEGRFGQSSSCITCHFRSAVSGTGLRPTITDPNTNCEGGFTGCPQRRWFLDDQGRLAFWRLDYVWSLMEARSKAGTLSGPTKCIPTPKKPNN